MQVIAILVGVEFDYPWVIFFMFYVYFFLDFFCFIGPLDFLYEYNQPLD